MSIIVKRATKGSALTSGEIDANVNNLNNDKVEINNPTFKAAPSLVNNLIPLTGTVLPAIYPSLNLDFANGKQLDPRITFSRNTVATYYDGKSVAKAEENLLTWSQDFSNVIWSNRFNQATIGSGYAAPDGTLTANNFTATAQYNYLMSTITVPVGTYTITIYARRDSGTNLLYMYTDLGQLIGSYNPTSVWQRFTFTYTFLVADTFYIIQERAISAYTPVYIWGAQLEQRSSVTAYTPTTSSPITNYIPVLKTAASNVPRFDYDPLNKKCLGLLIEESRTNLLTYSSDFRNTADAGTTRPWVYSAITLIPDTMIAPDGTLSMDAMVSSATGVTTHFISQSPVFTGIGTVTIYAKAGAADWFYITSLGRSPTDGAGQGIAWFNLRTGAKGAITAGFTSSILAVGNGVYRCTLVCTTSASANREARYGSSSADGLQTIDAPVDTILAFIWGAQLEAGSFATSYIPTVASTVTRAADNASMTGVNFSSWYNQAQGSLYAEADAYITGFSPMFTVMQGVSQNYIISLFKSDQQPAVYINAVLSANLTPGTQIVNTFGKLAWSQNGTVFTSSLNSRTPVTATSTAVIPTMNTLVIGGSGVSGGLLLNGHIKKLSYYPKALTAVELQGLTS